MNYGVFLEIEEGIEGLIHISEMSWYKHIKHPGDLYKIGDEIEAKVLSIDKETKKISLGIKQLEKDPWVDMEDKFKVGQKYNGKVMKFIQNGAFIEFEDTIYGFLQINDISWTRKIKHPSDILSQGEEIDAIILSVSAEDKRINLGLKQLQEDPWAKIDDYFESDQLIKGKLLLNLEKGLIFLLENDFEGILPISKVKAGTSKMIIGNEYNLKIIEINNDNRRIVLELVDETNNDNSEEVAVEEEQKAAKNNENSDKITSNEKDSVDNLKDSNKGNPAAEKEPQIDKNTSKSDIESEAIDEKNTSVQDDSTDEKPISED